MVAFKFFFDPFANAGDRASVPDAVTSDGSVSYAQGYGPDYSLDPESDPDAILVGRQQFNEIIYQITQALGVLQTDFPQWVDASLNGGTPYPYPTGVVVRYSDDALYQSTASGNVTTPGVTGATWIIFGSQWALTSALNAEITRAETAEALLAPKASPVFTGQPQAPTQSPGTGGAVLATCGYVLGAVQAETNRAQAVEATKAPLASPALTGVPQAPTAPPGTANTQIATTGYSDAGNTIVAINAANALANEIARAMAAEALLAPKANPTLTGSVVVPQYGPGTNSGLVASTGYTDAAVAVETNRAVSVENSKAPLASPGFSGVPTTPTPPPTSNDTTVPNTAWVVARIPNIIQGSIMSGARFGVPIGGSFAIFNFTWDQAFPTGCLQAVASCETNDVFVPGAPGNNMTAIAYDFNQFGGTVRVDTEQGRVVTGNIMVNVIGRGY